MSFLSRVTEMGRKMQGVVMEKLSPEVRYGHCQVMALALITAADGEVDPQEVEMAEAFIKDDNRIQRRFANPGDALEAFEGYLAELMPDKPGMLPVVQTKVINRVVQYCPDNDKTELMALAEAMAASDGKVHPKEQAIIDKLKERLGL